MKWRLSGFVFLVWLVAVAPAGAQDAMVSIEGPVPPVSPLPSLANVQLQPLREIPLHPDFSKPTSDLTAARLASPAVAPSLAIYATYGMLQALDVHSTLQALDSRAAEANPLIRSIVSSPVGFVALKTASTAGILYLVERVRRKNAVAALAFSIALSSVQAYVVVHNYRVARRR